VLDGHRGTEPNANGEARAMSLALSRACLAPDRVDYLNAHGTASRLGDAAELEAVAQVFRAGLPRLRVNSTKALTGHALSAAGVIEAVATLIQMNEGFLHPNPNLDEPMRSDVGFVRKVREAADVRIAMSNSFGFGGINTSILFARSTYPS
jgi:malonyl-ACP decarboxylase